MDDVLSGNNLRDDEKDKRYFQLQKRYLTLKEQLNSRTQPEEIITTVADLTSSAQDSSTTIRCVLYRFLSLVLNKVFKTVSPVWFYC